MPYFALYIWPYISQKCRMHPNHGPNDLISWGLRILHNRLRIALAYTNKPFPKSSVLCYENMAMQCIPCLADRKSSSADGSKFEPR